MTGEDLIFGDISQVDIFGDEIQETSIIEEPPKTEVKEEIEEEEEDKPKKEKKQETSEPIDIFEDSSKEEDEDTKSSDTDYKSIAQALVAVGEWDEDLALEDEDGNVIPISDLESMDEETFNTFKAAQAKSKKQKVEEEVYGKLSSDEKEFIEFKKNGGDLDEFLQTYTRKQRVESLDISTDAGKKTAIYSYYKNVVGWAPEKIQKHIQRLERDLELDEEAETAKAEIDTLVKSEHDALLKRQDEFVKQRQEAEQKYKENIKNNLKQFNFDPKKINTVLRDVTERDENGFTAIDKKFLELRNNPEEIEFLYSALMDRENFIKRVSQKKVNEEKLKTFKTIKVNKKSKSSVKTPEEGENDIFLI
jgi:hypothetical protein